MKIDTKAGVITAVPYDDGIAKGIELQLNGDIICMLDVMTHPTEGDTRLIVYADYEEDEPTHIIEINKDKGAPMMPYGQFKTKLTEAFKTHIFMKDRDYHTINELLYVLERDSRFNGEDFNISICTIGGYWTSIPCLDAFVPLQIREMWFNDTEVEFEIEECDDAKYNCITIYEREEK